jgi:hypothetical protein
MAEKHEKTVTLPGTDVFKKATDESLNRIAQMLDDATKMQAKFFEASTASIEESSELAKTSVKYVTELSNEWRRISLESTKKAMELFAR